VKVDPDTMRLALAATYLEESAATLKKNFPYPPPMKLANFLNFLPRRRRMVGLLHSRPNECSARRRERLIQEREIRAQLLVKIGRAMKGIQ
jgi:hypothetical protein